MGSIVRSTGYMMLHRPVEPAGIIGMWSKFRPLEIPTFIRLFRELRDDTIRLYHSVCTPVMVNSNIKTIQRRDQESGNGVKGGWNLTENVIAVPSRRFLPDLEELRLSGYSTRRASRPLKTSWLTTGNRRTEATGRCRRVKLRLCWTKFRGTGHVARPRQVSSSMRCSSKVSRSAPSSRVSPV